MLHAVHGLQQLKECRCSAHRDGQCTEQAVYLALQSVLRQSDLEKTGCRALEGELSAQLCTTDCRRGQLVLHSATTVFTHTLAVEPKYLPLY